MEFSDVVAVLALMISVASGLISFKAYQYTVDTKESETRRSFIREKSELLVRIDKAQKLFDQLECQLTSLIQRIDSSSDSERNSLNKKIDELNSDLSFLEGCRRQAWSLWDEIYEMNQDGFAHHKPRFLKLIEDDEEFAREASQRLTLVEDVL